MRSWLTGGAVAVLFVVSACTAATPTDGDGDGDGKTTAKPGYLAVADSDAQPGGTLELQVGVDSDAATGYDPQLADVASTWQLLSLSYETLTTIGPDAGVEPLLAERWETPDPTTYVFHLRDGVTFSNGREMTADDVVGSLDRLLASESVWRAQLGPVEKVTKKDAATVEVKLSAPYTPFLAALANVPAAILPMKEIDAKSVDPAKELLGTGPFVVEDHRQDVSWTFERNEKYWAEGEPAIDGVDITIAPEESARVAAVQNGSAAMSVLGNVDSADMLAGASDVKVADQSATDFYYLMLNSKNPKFADERVRRAVNMAIDREQIAEVALGGKGKATSATPVGLPGAAAPAAGGDAEGARKLLAEAGAEDLSFTLTIYSTEPAPAVAQVMQSDLKAAGISMKIEQLDEASWSGKVYGDDPGTFDAALSWFAGYADAGMVAQWWNPAAAGFNVGFMKPNKELNGLITQVNQEPAGAGRKAALKDFAAAVEADSQMVPLVTRPVTVAYRTDLLSPSLYATEGYGNVLRLVNDFRITGAQ